MNELRNAAKTILSFGLPIPRFIRPVIRGLYRLGVFGLESAVFLKKIFFVEPVLRSLCEHAGRGLRAERLPYIRGCGSLSLGNDVRLSGRSCFYFMRVEGLSPRITIGDRVFIGNGCTLSAAQDITVGDDVLISSGVRIHDNDGHPLDAKRRVAGESITASEARPVKIEDGAWIGASAIILKGVTIGRNAVVGAGSVVTRDVAPDTIVAGNPAQERP